jgi:hypothetical protein
VGIPINHDQPYTEEVKAYLRERGRGYLIPANERRFGEDGTRVPEAHESVGTTVVSPFYDPAGREKALYDVGGAPLPGTVLDYDTGRVADRENGVLAEYTGPGHTPGAHDLSKQFEPEGFESVSDEDDDIDDDIVSFVTGLKTKSDVQKRLTDLGTGFESDANRQRLDELLAITLQDLRDDGHKIELS